MGILGQTVITEQRLPQDLLAWRVVEVLLAPNDVCDLHEVIVHHAGKIVRGEAVTLLDDEVCDLCRIKGDLTSHHVCDHNRGLQWNREPHGYRPPLCLGRFNVSCAGQCLWATVDEAHFPGLCIFAPDIQLFSGVKAVIGPAFVEELLDVFFIDIQAVGLSVWAIGAADLRAFIPRDPEPLEVLDDLLCGCGCVAFLVRVLNT